MLSVASCCSNEQAEDIQVGTPSFGSTHACNTNHRPTIPRGQRSDMSLFTTFTSFKLLRERRTVALPARSYLRDTNDTKDVRDSLEGSHRERCPGCCLCLVGSMEPRSEQRLQVR